jgi:hypothetical protein
MSQYGKLPKAPRLSTTHRSWYYCNQQKSAKKPTDEQAGPKRSPMARVIAIASPGIPLDPVVAPAGPGPSASARCVSGGIPRFISSPSCWAAAAPDGLPPPPAKRRQPADIHQLAWHGRRAPPLQATPLTVLRRCRWPQRSPGRRCTSRWSGCTRRCRCSRRCTPWAPRGGAPRRYGTRRRRTR